jgi:DNA-binding NtrC family response regulator
MNKTAKTGAGQVILLVDDDVDSRNELRRMLIANDLAEVETVASGVAALERLDRGGIALVLLDMLMPGLSGEEVLGIITERYPTVPVVMITAVSDVISIVKCIKTGAFDYLTKPLDTGRLFSAITRALKFSELNSQNQQLRNYLLGEPLNRPEIFANILTQNNLMRSIFKLVEMVAVTDHPVLICGETGVGKELLAQAVHAASGLNGEFVPVNVAGLDDVMFCDTLFGHRKGAFTGAAETREGLIKKAEGGTLFLDEIGDLSAESQKALLRLLQEKEYYRMGSDILFRSNARVVTASNRDLKAMIAAGTFRRDLYHRLTIHEIQIPPLRERRDDIPLLVQHFARTAAESLGKSPPVMTSQVKMALLMSDFPGNVRELQNRICNAVVCNLTGELTMDDFPELAATPVQGRGVVRVTTDGNFTLHAAFAAFPTIDEVEQLLVQEALKASEGSKTVAAELLGISRPTLNKKLSLAESGHRE